MGVGAVKAGEAFVRVFSDDTDLVRGLRGIEAKYKKLGSGISGVGKQITGLGAAVASVGAVGLGALSWPLQLASNMESTEAAFTTLLKDTDKAKKLLGELQGFAASTPFQFDELADASKKLLAFGSDAENVQGELRRIGDIASAIGAPIGEIAEIYGKARVQGRLFAEDINQLTGRGIPIIQELAKQFGVTDQEVKKLVENGQIGFGNLEKAFASLTSGAGQFAGGMERQSKTLAGTFSTLKDNIIAAFRPFGEVLLPYAKAALTVATKVVAKFAEFAKNNKGLVIPLAGAFAAILAIGSAAAAAGVALVAVGSAISAIGAVSGALATLTAAVGAPILLVAGKVLLIVGAITAAVVALGGAFLYVAHKAGILMPAFNAIKSAIGEVFATFKQTFGGIVAALGSGQFGLAAKIAWAGVQLATLQGTQKVLEGIEYLWANAGQLSIRFFSQLGALVYKVFKNIPSIALSALRGGAALSEALSGVLADAFSEGNLSSGLDGTIAKTQARLNALTKQANAAGAPAGPAAAAGGQGGQAVLPPPPAVIQQQQAIAAQRQRFARLQRGAVEGRPIPRIASDGGIPSSPPGLGGDGSGQQMLSVQQQQLFILQRIAKQGGLD